MYIPLFGGETLTCREGHASLLTEGGCCWDIGTPTGAEEGTDTAGGEGVGFRLKKLNKRINQML